MRLLAIIIITLFASNLSGQYWVLSETLGYSTGVGQAPEQAKQYDSEKEWNKAIEQVQNEVNKELDAFFFSDVIETNQFDGIRECLKDHKIATNKNKFTVAQLREYAKEYHSRDLAEDFIKEANETKLIQALQELYK